MNSARRKRLENIQGYLSEVLAELEGVLEEEQEAFDNMPESLQTSERGEISENAIGEIESAIENISDAIDSIENARC